MARRKGLPNNYTEVLQVRFTPEDYLMLREIAERENDTAQEMVRIAIRQVYKKPQKAA